MSYGFKTDISNLGIFTQVVESNVRSILGNVLAEEMFWTKVVHQISTFWTFHCLSEVVQIPHVIFETGSQFLSKLCTILYIIS